MKEKEAVRVDETRGERRKQWMRMTKKKLYMLLEDTIDENRYAVAEFESGLRNAENRERILTVKLETRQKKVAILESEIRASDARNIRGHARLHSFKEGAGFVLNIQAHGDCISSKIYPKGSAKT